MPRFSKSSQDKLSTAHSDLQRLFNEVIKYFDCTVTCGYRGEIEQQLALDAGMSKAAFGHSAHNYMPSYAVDVVPYPINWKDRERMTLFGGFVLGMAAAMNIKIRWGGDWNGDTEVKDNNFDDLPHFELIGWREWID